MNPLEARHEAVGLWQRKVIEFEDGTSDRSMRVFWGQTRRYFVDIRIPVDRPAVAASGLGDLSKIEMSTLALQRGFAGILVRSGDLFTWDRHIDYQPSTGRPDQAIVQISSNILRETGTPDAVLGVPYTEIYERICAVENQSAVLTLDTRKSASASSTTLSDAILIVLDDHFMLARARPMPLPLMATGGMPALLEGANGDTAEIALILDCELSMGRIGGTSSAWKIDLSTFPWREGRRLFLRDKLSLRDGQICQTTEVGDFLWTIEETSLPAEELLALMR
jgi:hypothetical protein